MSLILADRSQALNDMKGLPRTGSFNFNNVLGGTELVAPEDGSRISPPIPFVQNTGDTSITAAFVAQIKPNSGLGYLIHGGGGGFNNFEIFINADGTLQVNMPGVTGSDSYASTATFDDDVERLYVPHWEDSNVKLFAGAYVDGGSMAEVSLTQQTNTFDLWLGLATITFNTVPSGAFPLESGSTFGNVSVWNNLSPPTVAQCDALLLEYLTAQSQGSRSLNNGLYYGLPNRFNGFNRFQ